MNNAKFTKGKWSTLNDQRSRIVCVAMCDGDIVAISTGIGPEELEANANLIAAAPEMYNYLSMQLRDVETLRDELLGDDDYESLFTGDKEIIDSYTIDIIGISKLLAKARGE